MTLFTQALIILPKVACLDLLTKINSKGIAIIPLLEKWSSVLEGMMSILKEKNCKVIKVSCPDMDEIECISIAYAMARKYINQGYIPTFCTDRTDWIFGAALLTAPALHTHIHKFKSSIAKNLSSLSELNNVLKYDIELLNIMACSSIPKLPLNTLDKILELMIDYELKDDEISYRLHIGVDEIYLIRKAIFESSRCRALGTGLNRIIY